jgi:hypothetical protein
MVARLLFFNVPKFRRATDLKRNHITYQDFHCSGAHIKKFGETAFVHLPTNSNHDYSIIRWNINEKKS